jgi:integrase
LRWHALDLDAAEVTFGGSTAVVRSQRVDGTTKGGRSRTVSIDGEPSLSCASTAASRQQNV